MLFWDISVPLAVVGIVMAALSALPLMHAHAICCLGQCEGLGLPKPSTLRIHTGRPNDFCMHFSRQIAQTSNR